MYIGLMDIRHEMEMRIREFDLIENWSGQKVYVQTLPINPLSFFLKVRSVLGSVEIRYFFFSARIFISQKKTQVHF